MAAALPFATAGIGGLLQGIGRSKSQTGSSSFNQNQSGTQEANLSGKQKKVNKALFQQILEAIKMGPSVSQSDRNTMRSQVNNSYDAANTNLEANLAARGYGEGGKAGQGMRGNLLERLKAIQGGEATLRDQAQNRFQQMIQNAFAFNTPRSFSSTGTSSGTSTSTMPGQSPWSTFGSGISDLSSMLFMKNMGAFGGAPAYCWIAEACYGKHDFRVFIVRVVLARRAQTSKLWFMVVLAYRLLGKPVAWLTRRSAAVRGVFEPLFDQIVLEAINV